MEPRPAGAATHSLTVSHPCCPRPGRLQAAQAEEGIRAAEERAKALEERKHAMFLQLKKVGTCWLLLVWGRGPTAVLPAEQAA